MDAGMGGTTELSPIMCLCALYEVTKKTGIDYEGHATCEAMFRVALKAMEEGAKPAPKKKAAPKKSRTRK